MKIQTNTQELGKWNQRNRDRNARNKEHRMIGNHHFMVAEEDLEIFRGQPTIDQTNDTMKQ